MTQSNKRHTAPCQNCQTPLHGQFCSDCGQKQVDLRVPILQLVSDILGQFFSFDSRLTRTLIPLMKRPGFLTKRYLAGQRAHFVPPLRLYIFISLIFFFCLSISGMRIFTITETASTGNEVAADSSGANVTGEPADSSTTSNSAGSLFEQSRARFSNGLKRALSDPTALNTLMIKSLPQMMFFLVPVLASFLWLLYYRQGRYYIEHLIFAIHYHCYFYIIMTFVVMVERLLPDVGKLLILALPIYLYFGLRHVFLQSRWRTLLKLLALGTGYFITLIICALLLMTYLLITS